ncbi:MAG: class I SAM-dependent methyltransferase [Parasphingopyxis sp.]|nr:class I SAM-dependent methyltransferase [Sphingomonadales bacterium]
MSYEQLRSYLGGPFAEVEGWCIQHLWLAIEPLADAIKANGDPGPIGEIGVFHGKFFIGLVHTMGASEGNTAIDVFDMQEFNLDGAGKGNQEIFGANLEKCGIPRSAVDMRAADSMGLTADDASELRKRTGGGFSLFSVDGCHTVEHTMNDLGFALEVTRRDGIIFVDDYYNANWPGVQEGVAKLYHNQAPRFVPLVYTSNKLFLCNLSFHERYIEAIRAHLKAHHPEARYRDHRRYGYRCLSLFPERGAPSLSAV